MPPRAPRPPRGPRSVFFACAKFEFIILCVVYCYVETVLENNISEGPCVFCCLVLAACCDLLDNSYTLWI